MGVMLETVNVVVDQLGVVRIWFEWFKVRE